MLLDNIFDLAKFSADGRPFIYKNTYSISLLFDSSAIQSEMYLNEPDELLLGYTITMMGFLLFNDAPQKIAMIGLGGGSLVKYCYRHLPQSAIVVAENNPEVIALRKHFQIPQDDHRLQIVCMDGCQLVREADNEYDVLLVDGFDRSGQPPQLCSQAFYDDCYQALAQGGMMVVNLLGSSSDTDLYLDRIQHSFGGAAIAVDARESGNRIVFACKGERLDTAEQNLLKKLKNLSPHQALMLRLTAQNIVQQRRIDKLATTFA
ncbi:fused MFS/spermidine synthase [Collimonas pratensis]|uniref:Spermine/spermidine synthase family protein n=1 Tax=Collimonas pratensis TaxID=279113 RepID=A0ABM5ZBC7_9BURK|nr:fused MFS/spermidine synthase [Collimonas pratensis]AMP16451.1 spermine/spermidine synthase family protein [Collimonas pratensis]